MTAATTLDAMLDVSKLPRLERCPTHGSYDSHNVFGRIWSPCPACARDEQAAAEKVEADQKRAAAQQVWAESLSSSCIPERFLDRTLKNYKATTPEQRYALDFAVAYADGFDAVLKTGRCAIFAGLPGTGKTHLAAGIALRLMHRDKRRVLFSTVMRAIRSVKGTWSRGSELTETQAIAALVSPDLLILDEVGVQFGSDTEKLILFDVLNERYEKRKPTLLLSNLTIDDRDDGAGHMVPGIKSFLGERIFDRLREDGGEVVPFTWESERGRI